MNLSGKKPQNRGICDQRYSYVGRCGIRTEITKIITGQYGCQNRPLRRTAVDHRLQSLGKAHIVLENFAERERIDEYIESKMAPDDFITESGRGMLIPKYYGDDGTEQGRGPRGQFSK